MGLQGSLADQAQSRAVSMREALLTPPARMFMTEAQKQFTNQTADLLEAMAKELKRLGGA